MTDDEIKDTLLYKLILAKNLSPEFNLNIMAELRYAFDNYEGQRSMKWRWNARIGDAFLFKRTPQGFNFWLDINHGELPKEYQ